MGDASPWEHVCSGRGDASTARVDTCGFAEAAGAPLVFVSMPKNDSEAGIQPMPALFEYAIASNCTFHVRARKRTGQTVHGSTSCAKLRNLNAPLHDLYRCRRRDLFSSAHARFHGSDGEEGDEKLHLVDFARNCPPSGCYCTRSSS